MEAVRVKVFRPDAARTNRWAEEHTLELILSNTWSSEASRIKVAVEPEVAESATEDSKDVAVVTPEGLVDVEAVSSSDEASSSSLSTETSGDNVEVPEEAVMSSAVLQVKVKVGFEIAYQIASFARHVFNVIEPARFVCGRLFSANFVKGDLDVLPFCANCLRKGQKDGCVAAESVDDFDGVFVTIPT